MAPMINRAQRIEIEKIMVAKFAVDVTAWLKRIGKDHVWLAEQLHLNSAVTSGWVRGRRFPCTRDLATVLSLSRGEIQVQARSNRTHRVHVPKKTPKEQPST